MSATLSHPSIAGTDAAPSLRFGVASGSGDPVVQWFLKRNGSAAPRQVVAAYASLALLSLGLAMLFWAQGLPLVLPFAGLEVAILGGALLIYAGHAADSERIRLEAGRLTVEHISGRHVDRAEFAAAWVRVEPVHGDRSLIELSGQGERISVGRFVRPELRRQLADELRWTLRRWQWMSGSAHAEPTSVDELQDKSEN